MSIILTNVSGNTCPSLLPRKKLELMKSFEGAKSIDESVKAFKELERHFDESDLGMECWIIARKILNQDNHEIIDFEKGLCYGKRALRILLANFDNNKPCFGKYAILLSICTDCQTPSYFISRVCNLLGFASFKLKRHDESISYLNWANRNLSKLDENSDVSSCTSNCVRLCLLNNQSQLYWVKIATGEKGETAIHAKKVLEVQEKLLEKDCIELGEANMNVYKAYCAVEDFEAALPFCLKALEIQEKHLGRESEVVAETMNSLGVIYQQVGEYEKGNVQSRLAMSVLKNTGAKSHMSLMDLGKYEEAVKVLEGEVSRVDIDGDDRASSFLYLAKCFIKLGKFTDAKKRLRMAKNIFEKKGINPSCAALGFGEMACLYKKLNDPETALSFARRAIEFPNIPQPILSRNASILFSMSSQSRKVKEGIPYQEDAVEKLKASFGPEHIEVGFGYSSLGLAYFHSGQQELGVKYLTNAKDMIDAILGPNHLSSLMISQTLSTTCATMGRFNQSVRIQRKVVEGLKGLGPGNQDFKCEAVMHLNRMKKVANASSLLKDGENLCETVAKCGERN